MTTTVLELNVSGMICRACEDAIADALLHTRGVVSAQAHYWRGRVTITYDPNIVTEDTLRQVLTNAGYPPGTHGMAAWWSMGSVLRSWACSTRGCRSCSRS